VEGALYADSSALTKLAVEERESPALRSAVAEADLVSSIVSAVEVPRAVRALGADRRAARVIQSIVRIELTEEVVQTAVDLDPPVLRSLDAIHLASALSLGPALEAFVCYDRRLSAAAEQAGLSVLRPE
jgi:uncharacterized protein